MSSLTKLIHGNGTPDPESVIAGVRALAPGLDDQELDVALAQVLAAKDAKIVSLTDQLAAATTAPALDPKWKIAIDEDFSSGKLDTKSFWPGYDGVPGTGNVGMRKGSLCTFRDGNLIIAAERPDASTTDWNKMFSTGIAAGPKSQLYGRYEVRQKASKGAGFWPNLQLWPTAGKQGPKFTAKQDGWPVTIEFDIAESPEADRSKAHTTVHYGANNTTDGTTIDADFTQFHIWIVEWTADAIVVYLDGKEIRRITDKKLIPTTPHHLVIQSDMGSWAGKPTASDPLRMEIEVDYLKQWALTS